MTSPTKVVYDTKQQIFNYEEAIKHPVLKKVVTVIRRNVGTKRRIGRFVYSVTPTGRPKYIRAEMYGNGMGKGIDTFARHSKMKDELYDRYDHVDQIHVSVPYIAIWFKYR